jgi:hypothetical protein
MQPPLFGEAIHAIVGHGVVAFQQLLLLQPGRLAKQTIAVGPSLVGVRQVAEGRPHEPVGGPKKKVQKLFSAGLHDSENYGIRRQVQYNLLSHMRQKIAWLIRAFSI